MLRRWSDFRRRQREILRLSNIKDAQDRDIDGDGQLEPDLLTETLPIGAETSESSGRRDYGTAGRPLNRQSPFYVGFVGALGVLVAYGLYRALGQLTQVITLLLVSLFLTLALNPLVESLTRRGMRRPLSVTIVFIGLIGVFTALGFVVVPPVAQQSGLLADNAPKYLDNLLNNQLIQGFDSTYHVAARFQTEVQKLISDGNFMSGVFGGVLGAGKALAAGCHPFLPTMVLTHVT